MKKLLSGIFLVLAMVLCLAPTAAFAAEGDVEINEANFPDSTFRTYVKNSFDTDNDGMLSAAELAAVTTILVSDEGISNLAGIEHFANLTKLNCCNNQLTSLNVSHNTSLKGLFCYNNKLTSLDVSHNTYLTELSCNDNQLSSLDVSHNTSLKYLFCYNNQLTSLDVSHNTELQNLGCGNNQLTSLDVSHNTSLTVLSCYNNKLTSLDASHNTNLRVLNCYNNKLTSLDASHNTYLTDLSCNDNQLSSLDVSHNTYLQNLGCDNNQLTSLDVSHNTELQILCCSGNRLTSLDVSGNTVLWAVVLSANSYAITALNNTFDLSTLPGSFDAGNASNWSGATVENGRLTIADGITEVTYTYDCGKGNTETFTLNVTHTTHAHVWSAHWNSNAAAHWHECTVEGCPVTENSEKDGYASHNLTYIPAKPATAAESGNTEYYHCDVCSKCFSDENATNEIELSQTVTAKLAPSIIAGDGAAVTEGEQKALSFTSDAAFADFLRVEMDGETVSADNYTVISGSTIVTLNAGYVAALPVGSHALGIVSQSGTAVAGFTVNKRTVTNDAAVQTVTTISPQTGSTASPQTGSTTSPQTGDTSELALWVSLFLTGSGVLTVLAGRKKKCSGK